MAEAAEPANKKQRVELDDSDASKGPSISAELNFHVASGDGTPEWVVENPITGLQAGNCLLGSFLTLTLMAANCLLALILVQTMPFLGEHDKCAGEPSEFIHVTKARKPVTVYDGRSKEAKFASQGYELIAAPTTLSNTDFYDEEKVRSVYYAEVEAFMKEHTGCSRTLIFDHTLRCTDPERAKEMKTRSPAAFVHGDLTSDRLELRVRKHLEVEDAEKALEGRYTIVNIWRGHNGTIHKNPMCFMDNSKQMRAQGVVYPVKRTSRHQPDNPESYIEFADDSPDSVWCWYPNMARDEAVIFKTADSAQMDGGVIHTSFDSPVMPDDFLHRESIECRVLCFWDN